MARRFSVRLTFLALVNFWPTPERRTASGRTVRSKKGCWSSISSSVLACIEPSWSRRAWTGSAERRLVSAKMTSRMPDAASMTMNSV